MSPRWSPDPRCDCGRLTNNADHLSGCAALAPEVRARELERDGNTAISNGLILRARRLFRRADAVRRG